MLLFTPEQYVDVFARVFAPLLFVLHWLGLWLWRHWVNHKRRVIHGDWMELEFAPLELRAERLTVLAAVKLDWRALEFAVDALKADKEIVQDAVRQSWRALRFASRDLRCDRDIMIGAVRQSNGWALEFAAEELYQDQELVTEATARLGGPLGLPLTPITTFVPVGPEAQQEGGHPGRAYGLQAVPIAAPGEEGAVGAEDSDPETEVEEEQVDDPEPAAAAASRQARREARAAAAEARSRGASAETPSAPVEADASADRSSNVDPGRCEVRLDLRLESRCGCFEGLRALLFPAHASRSSQG